MREQLARRPADLLAGRRGVAEGRGKPGGVLSSQPWECLKGAAAAATVSQAPLAPSELQAGVTSRRGDGAHTAAQWEGGAARAGALGAQRAAA